MGENSPAARTHLQGSDSMKLPTYYLPESRNGLVRVHVERFKAFHQRVDIDLHPITVIAGANSSGKSALIQSLLLAKQTLITPYHSRTEMEHALIFDGDLVRCADFHELVAGSPQDGGDGIRLGFTWQLDEYETDDFVDVIQRYLPPNVPLTGSDTDNVPSTGSGTGLRSSVSGRNVFVDLDVTLQYDTTKQVVVVHECILTCTFQREEMRNQSFTLGMQYDQDNDAWHTTLNAIHGKKTEFFRSFMRFYRFVPTRASLFEEKPDKTHRPVDIENIPLLPWLQQELIDNLSYLGPLRSAPQRVYVRRNVAELDIGTAGEYTIQQLHSHWNDDITFVDVPDNIEGYRPEHLKPKDMPLGDAVQAALCVMGMQQKLTIERHSQSYEVWFSLLSDPDTSVPITDVGFGISQILPVIALGLLSNTHSILIFEQPEIHLHPSVQAGLADFLFCLARTGRRVLIETHSDHLINRLRRRVAEDKTNRLHNLLNLLFVSPPNANHHSATVEQAKIDRFGQIENWPPGFLAESPDEARKIVVASADKMIEEEEVEDKEHYLECVL